MKLGIDAFAFYTPRYVLDLALLASVRGVDPDKFAVGLGQHSMSVPPPGEDIVTMGGEAALQALIDVDVNDIALLLFATESGIDHSKAAGIYVHDLLKLSPHCRVVEFKQACYAGTAAVQLALSFLRDHPKKKVLVIASDIARYGLNTAGESSQGAAAVAMVLSVDPRIIAFSSEYGVITENIMDFWRPNYLTEALVDGKYSSKIYLTMLEKSWRHYQLQSQRTLLEHDYFCYHTPVPRLVEKAQQHLFKVNQLSLNATQDAALQASLSYARMIGNSYTASLYLALISLLENLNIDCAGKRIGFYSYGSGSVAEFFSGVVQPHYQSGLRRAYHQNLLSSRTALTYAEYEDFYNFAYVKDGSLQTIPVFQVGNFRLSAIDQHKRLYEKSIVAAPSVHIKKTETPSQTEQIIVRAPGKIILSGEHSVVYGKPALAVAINRYVKATLTKNHRPQVLFDLTDLEHTSDFTFAALRHLKNKLKDKYHHFIRGEFSIRDVIQKPFELAQLALGVLSDALNLSENHGVKVTVQSDLPIGCGMGSSAATILSVMQGLSHLLHQPLSADNLFELALVAERMQHGRSNGLDLKVALNGGCLYIENEKIAARSLPSDLPLYLVNTGQPLTSTGQCVTAVSSHFEASNLADDFAAVTIALDQAIQQGSLSAMRMAMRANHRLLMRIGVVPERIQQFIAAIEEIKGAAKICGSGAIAGDQAGAVLIMHDDYTLLSKQCLQYGYVLERLCVDDRGLHAA